jgi:uncharacterized protein
MNCALLKGSVLERNIMWTPWSEPGLEHLPLLQQDRDILADSIIVGVSNHMPFRLHYEITCDSNWNVKELSLTLAIHHISR